ncbi:hypothetical protein [Cyclobacterium xiamenense]|uniref:hypothetical protein n=1 Tax=Cyclobacterium xiamenense TaxID=1297121 RepID=UPI0012B803A2|nr:hypothetical protein [Cyclobacterium xiamenense]
MIIPKHTEVVVCSYGGVGTTFLMEYLSNFKKINRFYDEDGAKHFPIPPISVNKNLKFVYIFGDPEMATISLFRRNFHHRQSTKLLRLTTKNLKPIPLEMSLEAYVSEGIDRFLFEDHFNNWYKHYLTHPTIFIRYENLYDVLPTLFDFLDIPREHLKGFPPKRERSSVGTVSDDTKRKITHMYGEFSHALKELPDCEIKEPVSEKPLFVTYLKPIYAKVMLIWLLFVFQLTAKKRLPGIYGFLRDIKTKVTGR